MREIRTKRLNRKLIDLVQKLLKHLPNRSTGNMIISLILLGGLDDFFGSVKSSYDAFKAHFGSLVESSLIAVWENTSNVNSAY